ncbi:hypothetical protein [Streptomyces chrestomyceticus]|uniref:hypothetical protein n=1 Tax=Streptomyces chrestomyceticus TaxID=68185 RepID=UPI0033DB91C9
MLARLAFRLTLVLLPRDTSRFASLLALGCFGSLVLFLRLPLAGGTVGGEGVFPCADRGAVSGRPGSEVRAVPGGRLGQNDQQERSHRVKQQTAGVRLLRDKPKTPSGYRDCQQFMIQVDSPANQRRTNGHPLAR